MGALREDQCIFLWVSKALERNYYQDAFQRAMVQSAFITLKAGILTPCTSKNVGLTKSFVAY
jgi:hypothetical protein